MTHPLPYRAGALILPESVLTVKEYLPRELSVAVPTVTELTVAGFQRPRRSRGTPSNLRGGVFPPLYSPSSVALLPLPQAGEERVRVITR